MQHIPPLCRILLIEEVPPLFKLLLRPKRSDESPHCLKVPAGVGRAEGDVEALVQLAGRGEAALRWRRATALIIDEVSRG